MKTNIRYKLLLLIFSGIISAEYSTTVDAKNVSKCRTFFQSGLYKLQANLSSKKNCLIVKADHVTIDLNGYTIFGIGNSAQVGISGSITQGLHVRNGTIIGFHDAAIVGPKLSTLNAMNILGNSGEGVKLGDISKVTDSIFANTDNGVALTLGEGSIIKDNTFYQNNIHLNTGLGSMVINNVGITGNEDGFNIAGDALVIGNNVTDTFDKGLKVGPFSNVINNNSHGNGATFDLSVGGDSNVIGNAAGVYEGAPIPGCAPPKLHCTEFHNWFFSIP